YTDDMPSRYTVKAYEANSYYHIYNRGVEKRVIFQEESDFVVLLSYLKTYLLPKDIPQLTATIADASANWRDKDQANKLLRLNNFSDSIELIAYCLMPNHYHFLIKQNTETAMDQFMNSLWTRYTMYFNKKYKRVGPLFQDVYKAVLVQTDEQLLHLTRYIHRNPIAHRRFRNPASQGDALRSYSYSSYLDYLGLRHTEWVHPEHILSYWSSNQETSYEAFILQIGIEEISAKIITPVII
ncbi:MAG: transposase, partial [Candidatus Gottesmanbacteria bacterium]|nr:transposase [Candidatus Gottesmanbacteria bacterium]